MHRKLTPQCVEHWPDGWIGIEAATVYLYSICSARLFQGAYTDSRDGGKRENEWMIMMGCDVLVNQQQQQQQP